MPLLTTLATVEPSKLGILFGSPPSSYWAGQTLTCCTETEISEEATAWQVEVKGSLTNHQRNIPAEILNEQSKSHCSE